MKTRSEWILGGRHTFDHWLEIRFGGSGLETSGMEETNPILDTGYLPYPAATTQLLLSAPFQNSSRARVVAHWQLPPLALLGPIQQGQWEAPHPL